MARAPSTPRATPAMAISPTNAAMVLVQAAGWPRHVAERLLPRLAA